MAFIDANGYPLINEEQKIRIALSDTARITIGEDMNVFGVTKTATFINTVFANYRSEAKSSISLYLNQREMELDRLFSDTGLDSVSKKAAVKKLLSVEEQQIEKQISEYTSSKGESKLYHINDSNVDYLIEDCDEDQYYNRPGLYMRSVIEEYCSLPFIKRERIYKREIFDTIERACSERRILKIEVPYFGKKQLFYVYPYKIMPDPYHTQSYLVCYSRKADESDDNKIVASFTMAKINKLTMLTKTFHLNKQEVSNIESQLINHSPAYLIGRPEQIRVRLTENGKRSYQSRLYSRPNKIEVLSKDDIYVFDCSHLQALNYFFPFGEDAEILSPETLRERFQNMHEKALKRYKGV